MSDTIEAAGALALEVKTATHLVSAMARVAEEADIDLMATVLTTAAEALERTAASLVELANDVAAIVDDKGPPVPLAVKTGNGEAAAKKPRAKRVRKAKAATNGEAPRRGRPPGSKNKRAATDGETTSPGTPSTVVAADATA